MKNIFIPCVPHVAQSYSRSVDISEICYGYSKRTIITATYFGVAALYIKYLKS